MPDKHIVSLLLALSALGAVLVSQSFKDGFTDHHIDISYAVNEKTITVEASYPRAQSTRIQQLVQEYFPMTALPDQRALVIQPYDSPDGLLHIHIKSRAGYLQVVMQRDVNGPEAQQRMRFLMNGIKKALAEN